MKILFIGDSLIEYYDWAERFPKDTVVNSGVSGEEVEGLLRRVEMVAEHCSSFDMIFVMTGINNIAMGDFDILDPYREVLQRLADGCEEAAIVVQSLLPTTVPFVDNNAVRRINTALKRMAEKMGMDYLDIHSRFLDTAGRVIEEYLLDDGVHLSRRGYKRWSDLVERYITVR